MNLLQNPALVWAVVSAVISVAYPFLDSFPRVHAVLSTLAGFGIDLPTILAGLKRLLNGSPPAGGGGAGNSSTGPSAKPPVGPAAAARVWGRYGGGIVLTAWFALALGGSLIAGCLSQAKQAQAVTDVAQVAACVVAHETEPPAQIAIECGLPAAGDVISLLASMDQRAASRFACVSRDGGK